MNFFSFLKKKTFFYINFASVLATNKKFPPRTIIKFSVFIPFSLKIQTKEEIKKVKKTNSKHKIPHNRKDQKQSPRCIQITCNNNNRLFMPLSLSNVANRILYFFWFLFCG